MAKKWPIGLKIFMGTQETIIYRLLVRNPSYDAYFSALIFRPLLAVKWAWPPHTLLMIYGLQTRPKRWPTRCTFWVHYYLEIMFSKLSGKNPFESGGVELVIIYHLLVDKLMLDRFQNISLWPRLQKAGEKGTIYKIKFCMASLYNLIEKWDIVDKKGHDTPPHNMNTSFE